ncbi:MAG: restriction endonuclease subunit S [Methanoregula sp.]|nr:restriction endonuclease subunit S [Methanoregula sp.]
MTEVQYPMIRLCDAGVTLYDCDHRTPKPAKSGYPYIAIPQIQNGRLDLSEVRLISREDYESWIQKNKPQTGDIIVTRRARVGDTAVVPEGLECAIGQNLVILRSDGSQIDQSFLRWILRGPLYEEQMSKYLNVGAIFNSLNCGDIPKFEVPVPPLPIQHAIARILGSLDDKIELNRQMNETLEAMARAIFQSWFVDFDPVRAKAEGRDTGLPPEIAALFPDGFEEVEGRDVPKGWGVGQLSSIIDLLGGGTPKTSVEDYWNGDIPWFSVVDAPSDSDMFVIDTEKHITQAGVENSSTNIFPVGTTIITARGTVGKLALVGVPMAMNQSCYGIKGVNGYLDYFIHFLLKRAINELQQQTHGTVFETITRQTFDGVEIIVPPPLVAQKFDVVVHSNLEKIRNNLMESRTLAQIRDALLPKLMSGEIRVDVKL